MLATLPLRLSVSDDGLAIDAETFFTGVDPEGWRSELIEGKIVMSPIPNPPHAGLTRWLTQCLEACGTVVAPGRVAVPEGEPSFPEPDVMLIREAPAALFANDVRWEQFTPFLVVEVVSPDNAMKDFVRNVALYARVPSILEYWIVAPEPSHAEPTFTIYHRADSHTWAEPLTVLPGETYITPTLPGFTLVNRPR